MDLVNPSLNPPALQPTLSVKRFSQHSRGHSRSPSHSPVRPYSPLSLDPLLRSLSPSATLYAFTRSHSQLEHDSRSPSPRRRDLKQSFAKVSDNERDFGTRAAQACLDIRGWTRELAAWQWPGVFEEPEPARKKARVSMMSIGSAMSGTTNNTADLEHERYLGSLPASTVEEYNKRCQEVANGLDEIEMNELKDFALQAHQQGAQSIDGMLQSDGDHGRRDLDDFTAVVTATVLQTLPYLSELNKLLDTWTIRIAVLKQIPVFVDELERLRRDLDHGWAAIAVATRKMDDSALLVERNMQEMQSLIDARMAALGSTLDGFLDMLEGQEDTVPDAWLDRFEELEQRYAEWVVTAQQRVLGDELKTYDADSSSPVTPTATLLNSTEAIERARTPTVINLERARTPIPLEAEGLRSPIYHEIERAKTPVIHEIDRAKTPIMESFVAPVRLIDDEDEDDELEPQFGSSQADGLVRETQKSFLLQASDTDEPSGLHDDANLRDHTDVLPVNSTITTQTQSGAPELMTLPQSEQPSRSDEIFRAPEPPQSSSSTSTKRLPQSASDPVFSGADTMLRSPSLLKSRKGSILSRIFKRDKSSELKRNTSVMSEPAEPRGRPESSSSLVRAARRSFSRKRTPKPEQEPVVWGGRADSPSAGHDDQHIQPFPVLNSVKRASSQPTRPSTMQQTSTPSDQKFQYESNERPVTVSANEPQSRPHSYQQRGAQPRPLSTRESHFPENWPLGAVKAIPGTEQVLDDGDEDDLLHEEAEQTNLRNVRSMNAINSDNFIDVFIDGFPATPTSPITEEVRQADLAWAILQDGHERAPQTPGDEQSIVDVDEEPSMLNATPTSPDARVRVPVVTSSMLSSEGRQDDLSVARAISMDGLRKFDHSPKQYYSDKEVNTKYLIDTRDSSLPIAVVLDGSTGPTLPIIRNEGLTAIPAIAVQSIVEPQPQLDLPPQEMPVDDEHKMLLVNGWSPQHNRQLSSDVLDDDSGVDTRNLLKRASTASIKAHAASELRSIDVPARKRDSGKLAPTDIAPEAQSPAVESTAGSRRSSITYFERPGTSRADSRSGAQSPNGSMNTPNFSRLRSSSADTDDHRTPLNIAVAKRRLQQTPGLATINPSAEYAESPISEQSSVKVPIRSVPGDNFDRHVSEVLESLPAPIMFRNRAGDNIVSSRSSLARNAASKASRPRNTLLTHASSGTGLTLAPAEASPRRAAPSDPEIKLYHLTQTGRDEPIKLFVRLVGEGERVMVRVGGGWSDLADFLRQYAEHHGSRTVSGSINGLALQTAGNSPAGSRRTSGMVPIAIERRGRPASRDGQAINTPISPPQNNVLTSPVSVIDGIAELPGSEPPQSPATAAKQRGKLHRKPSKDLLSDQKARWVTRMLEKAKRETAPAKSKEGSFGSIGRIGSTRRVFFSSPSVREQQSSKKS